MNVGIKYLMLFTTFSLNSNVEPSDVLKFYLLIGVVIMLKKIKDAYNFSIPVLSLTIFLKFSLDIFYDIFYGESFGDSISFERTMLLTLFICMGIHIYKNMNNNPE